MNSKLQFERHLQFTAVIIFQQSHGFVVLIIPCYHHDNRKTQSFYYPCYYAGTIKEANINNRTGRLRTVLFKYFINASSMHSSMHYQCIHHCIYRCIINASCIVQCTIKSFINASSIHLQCTINTSSMYSLHQMHKFRSFISSFNHQCVVNTFINASPVY